MNKFFQFIKSKSHFLALPILSGILIGTSYIPFNGWALLFCYLPLFLQNYKFHSENSPLRSVFWSAWVTQFILTLIGFNWIYYVSTEFGHLHWSLALGALLAFAAFMHLYIPFSLLLGAYLLRKLRIKSTLAALFIPALCLALTERVWPSIFEWNLAYTFLWIRWPISQWADTVGFWGLSTWLYLFQAGLAYAYLLFKTELAGSFKTLGLLTTILLVLNLTGYAKQKFWSNSDQSVKIGVAQGNIGNAEKLMSEKKSQFHSYIRQVYTELTDKLVAQTQPDVVIWPETALPFVFESSYFHHLQQKKVLQSTQQWKTVLVTGAYSKSETETDVLGDPVYRNAVFYLSPELGYAAPPYYKTNLLAFGEYMPLGETFPILYRLLPFVGTYAKGSGPVVAEVQLADKKLRLGPQICYDSLVPGFSRDLAKNGAQIIYNVTNDSWFSWWAEPFQHQYMTLARAIEVRRPLVRSTNTGVSSAILADGTILTESPMNQKWQHTYEIKYKSKSPQSIYTQFGHYDWILWLGLLLTLVLRSRTKENPHV